MKRLLLPLFVILGILVAAAPGSAHHAFAAEYDVNKPISIKGTLTKLEIVNPHSWIYINVKDDNGKITSWAVECGSPNALLRQGLRKSDFPEGIEIVITGYRAKNGTPTVNGSTIKLPDGRNLFTGGSSPNEKSKE